MVRGDEKTETSMQLRPSCHSAHPQQFGRFDRLTIPGLQLQLRHKDVSSTSERHTHLEVLEWGFELRGVCLPHTTIIAPICQAKKRRR
jgi:hypothetical protein